MIEENKRPEHHVLIAVDDSESSARAVAYSGEMLSGMNRYTFHILHIINEPEEDFFPDKKKLDAWLSGQHAAAETFLHRYRELLEEKGVHPEKIFLYPKVRYCPSVAECILNERKTLDCKTVVIGRKGASREEEFLFGSVSNKIIHQARDCTVWVVE